MVHNLAPKGGAGFVLANGSMSSSQSGEGEIRKNVIEAKLVNCMAPPPGQLFYSTLIPVCWWFLARGSRRRGGLLLINARKLGRMMDRMHRELTGEEIGRTEDTYYACRTKENDYSDVRGFRKGTLPEEVGKHRHVVTSGR